MTLNNLGQAYATLLFKLLAQRHQQVLRIKKELVSDSTAVRTQPFFSLKVEGENLACSTGDRKNSESPCSMTSLANKLQI
jgi:hypothetical protein